MQEMQVRSLNQEDPLEEEMAAHSSYSCPGNPLDSGAWQAASEQSCYVSIRQVANKNVTP